MSRIASIFSVSRPILIPFVTGGFPSLRVTSQALEAIDRALDGRGIIEVGFPFTDPIADGPVIAASMHQALQAGVTPQGIFDAVREVRPRVRCGLAAMVSDSIITRIGAERFVTAAAASGFDGLIVPDVDLEAAVPLAGLARMHQLSFTLLIAPTTTTQRLQRIMNLCSGWAYVLARVGVTGDGGAMDLSSLRTRIELIRTHTSLPLAVGFGIADAAQVRAVSAIADGVIVGSALVKKMTDAGEAHAAHAAAEFVSELAAGLSNR